MIEIRNLVHTKKRRWTIPGSQEFESFWLEESETLQYRYLEDCAGGVSLWCEWKDVPRVMEIDSEPS